MDKTKNKTDSAQRRIFGNILRKIRKARDKSICELAKEAQVDGGYISRLENAHRSPPSPRILRRLADALDVHANILMMAAGHLEFDSTGQRLSEEDIIRLVEAELTDSEPDIRTSLTSDFQRFLQQLYNEGLVFEITVRLK